MVQYLFALMNSLQQSLELAAENLKSNQVKQKQWYDKRARESVFNPGDEGNKLQLVWSGPFRVIDKMNDINYVIQEEGEDI